MSHVPGNFVAEGQRDMGRLAGPMGAVHAREKLIDHANDGPDSKHAHGNRKHHQCGATFIHPQIADNFAPARSKQHNWPFFHLH